MTRGATDPRQRFIRLAAVVRQQRDLVARIVDEGREVRSEFSDREPPLLALRGIGGILHEIGHRVDEVRWRHRRHRAAQEQLPTASPR